MKLEKELLIDSFAIQRYQNAPYAVKAISGDYKSSLTIDDEILDKVLAVQNPRGIAGRNLIVTLNSREMPKEKRIIVSVGNGELLIDKIGFNEQTSWSYMTFPEPRTHEKGSYFAHLVSPGQGDGMHFSSSPCPNYDMNIPLSHEEYFQIKNLPKRSVFEIDLKLR
jgi:hypothetical protein